MPFASASEKASPLFWYFLVPGLTLFFHALAIDEVYRTLVYLNIVIIAVLALRLRSHCTAARIRTIGLIALPALVLTIFDLLSGHGLAAKEVRHLLSFTCLTLGFLALPAPAQIGSHQVKALYWFAILFVVSYVLIQGVTVYLLGDRDGTPRNPHYLAQYCLLLSYVSALLYPYSTRYIKGVLIGVMMLLALLLINTGSRPAWLALLISGALYYWLMRHRMSWKWPLAFAAGVLIVYLTNLGGLKARTDDLLGNVAREERVTIWQNTIEMQLASPPRAWLFGHGIDSFKQDFKEHSQFHLEGIDFSAPHNHLLEIVYTSGVLGLIWVATFLIYLFMKLFRYWRDNPDSSLPATLLALFMANMLFGAITISFFSSYSLLIISVVAGVLVHQRESIKSP